MAEGGRRHGGRKCGLVPAMCFIIALSAGTANTLLAKVLFQMQAPDGRFFQKPLFQTLLMFGAEAACLLLFGGQQLIDWWRRSRQQHPYERVGLTSGEDQSAPTPVSARMILLLALPALSDCLASVLLKLGLLFVTSSVYQLMCCLRIVFVAVNKQLFLGQRLARYMWLGIALNTCAIATISASSVLANRSTPNSDGDTGGGGVHGGGAAVGIVLIAVSCFVQSIQFVLEERFISSAIQPPPLLVVGVEGAWGVLMSILLLYPLAALVPGDDNGCYETIGGAVELLMSSRSIMVVTAAYFSCVFVFNAFGIYITKLLDALWKALVDSFRPVTVWGIDLALHYLLSPSFGEAWTRFGFVQLAGMTVLFVGTATYNGSLPCFRESADEPALKIRTPKQLASPALTDFSAVVHARWVNEREKPPGGDVEMAAAKRARTHSK